ncbi:transposase [Streptomyces sp. AC558_RSS880]|uniref:transposase n=1 Tax=Streptomyces sp. AC558_RSS880 TaxID=2823687 RepID=UPI0035AF07AD
MRAGPPGSSGVRSRSERFPEALLSLLYAPEPARFNSPALSCDCLAHGHDMRHCRYRGQPKTHLQHVLTAVAVNIERLSGLPPTEETPSPRPPTAFRTLLDQHGIPRSKSCRTLGS